MHGCLVTPTKLNRHMHVQTVKPPRKEHSIKDLSIIDSAGGPKNYHTFPIVSIH